MRILLIEDNHLFGEFIGAHIQGVTAVESLSEAVETLNHERFDLLLIDLGLPDSQGVDTLRAFSGFKVPKIVMTASSHLVREVSRIGCLDFIHKGSPNDIVERIQFNISKLTRKRPQLPVSIFEEIKTCLTSSIGQSELAAAV